MRRPGRAAPTREDLLLQLADDELRIERLGRLHPDDVDREVASDRQQPGRDPPATRVVCAGVLPGSHERLLGDVLGGALVTHDRQHQAVDARLEAADERRRSVGIAGRETGYERFI